MVCKFLNFVNFRFVHLLSRPEQVACQQPSLDWYWPLPSSKDKEREEAEARHEQAARTGWAAQHMIAGYVSFQGNTLPSLNRHEAHLIPAGRRSLRALAHELFRNWFLPRAWRQLVAGSAGVKLMASLVLLMSSYRRFY